MSLSKFHSLVSFWFCAVGARRCWSTWRLSRMFLHIAVASVLSKRRGRECMRLDKLVIRVEGVARHL